MSLASDGPSRSNSSSEAGRRVLVEYFYSPGCADCLELERSFLDGFTNDFAPYLDFRKSDISLPSVYQRLAQLQESLDARADVSVSVYVDGVIPLLGTDAIRANLEGAVMARLWAENAEPLEPEPETGLQDVLAGRFKSFSVPVVMAAGLADGVNPCAFATVIFLATLLMTMGVGRRGILTVGLGFSLAVFITYLLLGFGAFRVLRVMTARPLVGELLRWLMMAALVVLALISFRDALVFRRRGQASDVALRLPDRLKLRIHSVMRKRLKTGSLFYSAMGIGVIVALIEAACTGQVYLPTLIMMSRYAETRSRAFFLLILYNLMFIAPLLVVMLAACSGAHSTRLMEWSRKNVVWGKALMGLLFIGLAAILWIF